MRLLRGLDDLGEGVQGEVGSGVAHAPRHVVGDGDGEDAGGPGGLHAEDGVLQCDGFLRGDAEGAEGGEIDGGVRLLDADIGVGPRPEGVKVVGQAVAVEVAGNPLA